MRALNPVLASRTGYPMRSSGNRGFSLIELLVALAILTVVIGVAVRGLIEMQRNDFTQRQKTDAVQETRDFIDQMVRDLHDVGYPPRAAFFGNPHCGTLAKVACAIIYFSPTQIQYEGDLDGTGTVYRVWVQLQPGPGGKCPCILQRGVLDKTSAMGGAQPTYFTELNGVLNSGNGLGTTTYGISLSGPGSYATYANADVFDAWDTNASPHLPCFTASTCSDIASIQITVNSVPKYADQQTDIFPVYSITSKARVNNQQFDN